MESGIYRILNPEGEIYVGRSKNIFHRKNIYSKESNLTQPLLQNSIQKYGWDNHIFEIIEKCPIEKLNEREKYWIEFYGSYSKGLNKNLGGGGPTFHTSETKLKMSLAKKGKLSESHISSIKKSNSHSKPYISRLLKNQPSHFKGKKHTPSSLKKMSLAKKGKTYEEIYGEEKAKQMKISRSLPRKGKTILCLNEDKIFNSIREAAKYYCISENSIGNILLGYSKKTRKGLIFEYVN